MADTLKSIGRTVVETGVYLPIGAAASVLERLSNPQELRDDYRQLIARGEEGLRDVLGLLGGGLEVLQRRGKDVTQAVGKSVEKVALRGEAALNATAPTNDAVGRPETAEGLSIDRYDERTADEIVDRLDDLTQNDLARVYAYEAAKRQRVTILRAVEAKLTDLPIPGYDAMTVEEIAERLGGLAQHELETLRAYEERTKNRRTVLERIDQIGV